MLREFRPPLRREVSGFTLVEMIVSCSMVCLIGASSLNALSMFNKSSSSSRLQTAAQAVAKSEIELVQIDSPFNPQLGQVPSELAIGTHTVNDVQVYSDPNSGYSVTGTLTTTVTDAGLSVNGNNLNARNISVTVTYTYRGRNYSVAMSTMRVPDV